MYRAFFDNEESITDFDDMKNLEEGNSRVYTYYFIHAMYDGR